jgi:uncharacterized protein (TIGR03435 family)
MRVLVGLLIGGILAAQPAFDVASVKPTTPDGIGCTVFTYPGGRVHIHNCTVVYIMEQAFDEEKIVVPGALAWANDERYDLEARPPANSEAAKSNPSNFKLPPNEAQRLMLQTLLARRFQMTFHRDTKEDDVFLLKRGKALKLQQPKDAKAYPWAGQYSNPDVFAGMNITMPQLVKRLTGMLSRPVLDQTGLPGAFDFKSPYDATGEHADSTTFLIGSLNAIGLKLESSKAPIERIVVDRLEKPTPN